jgi:F420-non-reducing hydrogenase small subunit
VTKVPEGELTIPRFYPVLKTLDQVVDVDYFMPGCPPESHQIAAVVDLVIKVIHGEAELPPKGTVIGAGASTVCDDCPRERNVKLIKEFKRIQSVDFIDPKLCLLEQGIPCNGPASEGCGACVRNQRAVSALQPGGGVIDYGARLITAFASVMRTSGESIGFWTASDPRTVYPFNLARSLLRANKAAWTVKA